MQQKLIFILMIIVSLGAGIFIGTLIASKTPIEKKVDNSYNDGWAAAVKTLTNSGGAVQLSGNIEIKYLSGTILAVSEKSLTVKVNSPMLMSTPELVERTVNIDDKTKIYELTPKDPEQVKKEFDTFNEKIKKQGNAPLADPAKIPIPPQSQDIKAIKLSDLKADMIVNIQTAEDIKDKKQFTALEIQIQGANLLITNQTPPVNPPIIDPPKPTTPHAPAKDINP